MKQFYLTFAMITASLFATMNSSSAQAVPHEISQLCAERWGSDYRMQAYCRKTQMKAYREISASPTVSIDRTMVQGVQAAFRVSAKKGHAGLNRAIDKCYATIEVLDNLRYCVALDFAASIQKPTGRNEPKAFVHRVHGKLLAYRNVGSSYLNDIWLDQVEAAYDYALR